MLHESLMGWLMLLAPTFPAALFVVLGNLMIILAIFLGLVRT